MTIVGWRTAHWMPTELPLDAHDSDAGSQYTALRYSERLADVGALASIGTVGHSYDNAMAESVIGLYKNECTKIDDPFRTVDELELATLSWVHGFNHSQLHSSISYQTPIEAEQEYNPQIDPRQHPSVGRADPPPLLDPGRCSGAQHRAD